MFRRPASLPQRGRGKKFVAFRNFNILYAIFAYASVVSVDSFITRFIPSSAG
jgi:hypothetical protein